VITTTFAVTPEAKLAAEFLAGLGDPRDAAARFDPWARERGLSGPDLERTRIAVRHGAEELLRARRGGGIR
jgi:hypothetical protein